MKFGYEESNEQDNSSESSEEDSMEFKTFK